MNNAERPVQVGTKINQDEINKAGIAPLYQVAPDKAVKPLSLAYWISRADKTIRLKSKLSGSTRGKGIATLG
jgi:hypothetical protein